MAKKIKSAEQEKSPVKKFSNQIYYFDDGSQIEAASTEEAQAKYAELKLALNKSNPHSK